MWTPQESQLSSSEFLVNKCRHDINKLSFNRNTIFSNLSSEERAALENFSKRRDIIVKVADKGGALVFWRADLYQKEALQLYNFVTPLFMLKSIKISFPITNKFLRALFSVFISHVIKTKNRNRSISKFKNLGYDR